jgi:TetR/AcrR family transcriptional regulator, transcriptional repressor for nem operon
MARPRSFKTEDVLQTVMLLFWEKGYGATSMMDIQQKTGLKPGSIYDTFGDKHRLFMAAINHYRDNIVRERLRKLTQPGPARARIQTFFDDLIDFSLGEGRKLGCLMTNSAIELAMHDPDTKKAIQTNLVEIADTFYQVVQQGIDAGEFSPSEPAENIARFLTSTIQGLRVMAKSATTEETLRTTARLALKILD